MDTGVDTVSTCSMAFFALRNNQQPAARRCKAGTEAITDEERAGIRTFKFSNDRVALSTTPDGSSMARITYAPLANERDGKLWTLPTGWFKRRDPSPIEHANGEKTDRNRIGLEHCPANAATD